MINNLNLKRIESKKLLNENGFNKVKINKILPSPLTKGYRNEVILPVREVKGQLEVGFFESRTANFIPLDKSIITNEAVVATIYAVRDIMRKLKVPAYDPKTNSGFIKDIGVRRSQGRKGMIVTLITRENDRVNLPEIVGLITEKLHNINGVVLNYNPHKTDKIFGKSNIPLWGNDYVEDELGGIKFKISPKSYFQSNGSQLKPITDLALNLLDLKDDDKLIDAAVRMHPRRIVYSSTNLNTMVRDLADFKNKGYNCTEVTPVDTAPQTPKVKCFAVIVPKEKATAQVE